MSSAVLLLDLGAIFYPEWHKAEFGAVRSTVDRVRMSAIAYPRTAVCIDDATPGRSWRSAMYPEYKCNREEKEPSLVSCLARTIEILRGDGFPIWGYDGNEADDVIASACTLLAGHEIVIGAVDKDLAQLVSPSVSMLRLDYGETVDVKAKWGVHPMQMGDYLALVGDVSDNVPGVRFVGKKTAEELLMKYHHWEGIVAAAEDLSSEIKPKIREQILYSRELFKLSRALVELRRDLPIPVHEILAPRKPKMQHGTQIDLFACVEQPYPDANNPGATNMSNPQSSYDQQMAALQAQMNAQGAMPPSATPGQINPPQTAQAIPPIAQRQAPMAGYQWKSDTTWEQTLIASLAPVHAQPPPTGWRYMADGSGRLEQDIPTPAPSQFAPGSVHVPMVPAAPAGTPYTGGPLLVPAQGVPVNQNAVAAASGVAHMPFVPPAMTNGAGSVPTEEKPKRGRPKKDPSRVVAEGEISDESAIDALLLLRAWLRQ